MHIFSYSRHYISTPRSHSPRYITTLSILPPGKGANLFVTTDGASHVFDCQRTIDGIISSSTNATCERMSDPQLARVWEIFWGKETDKSDIERFVFIFQF